MMKKALALVSVLFLSGCVQVTSHHTLYRDQTEDLFSRIVVKVPQNLPGTEETQSAEIPENALESIPESIRPKVKLQENRNGVEIEIRGITESEKAILTDAMPEFKFQPYSLTENEGQFRYEMDPNFVLEGLVSQGANEMEELAQMTFLNHSVTVFGPVLETNGIQIAENVVSFWDLDKDEKFFVVFEKAPESTPASASPKTEKAIFAAIGIILGLILGGVFVKFFAKRS